MASAVTICSAALLKLGQVPISSFDDPTDQARLASALWEPAMEAMLRAHPWNCAVKRVKLSPDLSAPAHPIYSMQFTVPADCLRVISIGDYDRSPDYQYETGKILCNESELLFRYVFKNTSVATWDSLLVECMTAQMVAEFAYPLTQSTSLMQAKQQELEYLLRRARNIDAQENPPLTIDGSSLIEARFRGIR